MTSDLPGLDSPAWDLELLCDGGCSLCSREVAFLRRRDHRHPIVFEDLAAPGFDPRRCGLDRAAVLARIHRVLPDGRGVEGLEFFRRACGAIGLGGPVAPSRWPGLRPLFDATYRVFARNRLRWKGRATPRIDYRLSLHGVPFGGSTPSPAGSRRRPALSKCSSAVRLC
jgi:predicted DCC family thiol-disulfide oxidoreductase YuxK